MPAYDAVLFDNDGVLVEPPAAETQAEAARAAFREAGVEAPDEAHVDALVEGVTVDRPHDLCSAYDLDAAAFWAARERLDEESQLEAFRAGARDRYDDVAAVADLGPACGVVSNNHRSTVAFVLEFFELAHLFETCHGRERSVESLARKKPEPHYLERALADLGAESALYVGDSASDVAAAHRAGLDSAFVRRSHSRHVDLPEAPTHEVADLQGLASLVEGRAVESAAVERVRDGENSALRAGYSSSSDCCWFSRSDSSYLPNPVRSAAPAPTGKTV